MIGPVVGAPSRPFPSPARRPIAGDGLLHPVVLGSILVLILNDRVLKAAWPGLVTGKLSDVAGLLFAPLFVVALAEVAAAAAGRWSAPSRTWLTVAVGVVAVGFAAVKLVPPIEATWELGLGIVQWPVGAVTELMSGRGLPPIRPVDTTPDATDLIALPAVWLALAIGIGRVGQSCRSSSVLRNGAWWYEFGVAGLSVAMLVGATVDGWAHTHDPGSLETVLTAWHAIVYASFGAVALLVLGPPLAARLGGRDPVAAIPRGFGWAVVGVVAFGAVGLVDLAWHVAFGLEADTEALLSPTHLGLGVAAALIGSGPVRAAWMRAEVRPGTATWREHGAAVLAVVAIAGLAAFALHPVNLFVDAWPRWPYGRFDETWYAPNIGIGGAIVPTLIVMVPLLELVRRWPTLPIGTATLLVGGTMSGLTFLHDGQAIVGAPILGGVLVDLALLVLPPRRFGHWPLASLTPALIFVAYFVVVSRTGPLAWTAHLIGGTIVIASLTGLALALLARTPGPGEAPGGAGDPGRERR